MPDVEVLRDALLGPRLNSLFHNCVLVELCLVKEKQFDLLMIWVFLRADHDPALHGVEGVAIGCVVRLVLNFKHDFRCRLLPHCDRLGDPGLIDEWNAGHGANQIANLHILFPR